MASQLKQTCHDVILRLAGTLIQLQLRHELQCLDTSKRCFAAESNAHFARELQARIAAAEVKFRFVPDITSALLDGNDHCCCRPPRSQGAALLVKVS